MRPKPWRSPLSAEDLLHFHFPFDCIPGEARSIAGKYFCVSPYARRWQVPFFAENHRQVTLLDSEVFGRVVMAEVGAFTIGSIQQRYEPGKRVEKGAHKGFFELGGSIVVLLFGPGRIELAPDLITNSRDGIETYLRLGESVGHAK